MVGIHSSVGLFCIGIWERVLISQSRQLQNDTDTIDVWFPNILKNYETYVLHAYTIEESEMDQSEYLKVYLRDDLEVNSRNSYARSMLLT